MSPVTTSHTMYGRQVPLGPFHPTLVRKHGQSLPAKDELTRHSDQYTNPSPRVQNGFGHPPDIIDGSHPPLTSSKLSPAETQSIGSFSDAYRQRRRNDHVQKAGGH
jgi:hypothetical protein